QVMNKQWNHPPLPLSMDLLRTQDILQKSANTLFGLRTAMASMVLVAFAFFIWQLTTVNDSSGQIPSNILPVPTPSNQFSTASLESTQCEWSLHKVEAFDTLDSIALRYSVSVEEIMTFNRMDSELVYESMELKIPRCGLTPTLTAGAPTTTLTPIFESTTIDTPG
ncbi:MAG TPA: LysM peptidoglycan-binding domain-containing protein, partial [Anaerolineales bacterium]|nr:LysM peptidoglycan-binding domain-containing protein [Anaerolineales bacterium]